MSGRMKIWEVKCQVCKDRLEAPGRALLVAEAKKKGWMVEIGTHTRNAQIIDCPKRCRHATMDEDCD